MQSRLGALDGSVSPARVSPASCATPACRRIFPTTAPTGPRRPASNCRGFRFRAGATATPPRMGRTPTGRPPSRRTGSTRSTWSRCCSSTPPPWPNLTILNRTAFEAFEERDDGIVATVRNLDTRCRLTDRGRFPGRLRRRALRWSAAPSVPALQGTPVIQRVQSTYIRAPELLGLMGPPAWMTLALNPRRCGTVVAIDGHETWLIHNHLNKEDETFESVDRDCVDPRHPRRRSRFRLRYPEQGRLGRPAAGRPTASATAAPSSAAMPRICGFPMPATA